MDYTIAQAAELLGTTKTTIRNYLKNVDPAQVEQRTVRGQQWTYISACVLEDIRIAMEKNEIPSGSDENEPETADNIRKAEPERTENVTGENEKEPKERQKSTEQNRTAPKSPVDDGKVNQLLDILAKQLEEKDAQIAHLNAALERSQLMQGDLQRRLRALEGKPSGGTVEASEAAAADTVETIEPEADQEPAAAQAEPAAPAEQDEKALEIARLRMEVSQLREIVAKDHEQDRRPFFQRLFGRKDRK